MFFLFILAVLVVGYLLINKSNTKNEQSEADSTKKQQSEADTKKRKSKAKTKNHQSKTNTNNHQEKDASNNNQCKGNATCTIGNSVNSSSTNSGRDLYNDFMQRLNTIDEATTKKNDLDTFNHSVTEEIDENDGYKLYDQLMSRINNS